MRLPVELASKKRHYRCKVLASFKYRNAPERDALLLSANDLEMEEKLEDWGRVQQRDESRDKKSTMSCREPSEIPIACLTPTSSFYL